VGQGFRNAYERSKFEAELVVRERSGSLPIQVVRPSIVVGDSRTGFTPEFNVLYWPLRAFSKGTYPALPARRSAPVDVVPVDYVADAMLALAGREPGTYHLTAGERASNVGELMDMASAHFRRPAPRALPPRLYRRAIHPLLVRTGSQARRRALRRSEPFFPYFAMGVRYDDTRTRQALRSHRIEAPSLRSYFGRLVDYAQAAAWGRHPHPRHEAAGVAGSADPYVIDGELITTT
jgi:thioester reductase-like protein